MKPSGIVSFYNVPEDAGDPDVKVYVNNELVESGGGGGDGDFTTATITLANPDNEETHMRGYYPIVDESKGIVLSRINIGGNDVTCLANNASYTVPLYKGKYTGIGLSLEEMEISGDAEYDGEYLTVTGDCTITYWGGFR